MEIKTKHYLNIKVGPGERRVPNDGDVGRVLCRRGLVHLLLGLALLLLGLSLEQLEVLALKALLGQSSLTPVLDVGRLLLLRRPKLDRWQAHPLAHYSGPGVALDGGRLVLGLDYGWEGREGAPAT